MAEGLVIFTRRRTSSPGQDRDLVNEAINRLFDFKANDEQIQWFRDAILACSSTGTLPPCWNGKSAGNAMPPAPLTATAGKKNVMDFEYDSTYRRFNPKQYDPKMDVRRQKSGMKYAVLTSKHHDSFSNFPPPTIRSPSPIPLRQGHRGDSLRRRCTRPDLNWASTTRAGLVQSLLPDPNQHYRYLEYYFGQISELLTRYGQVDILWFDSLGSSSLNQWDPRTMIRRIKQYQPDILINNRMNGTRGGNKGPPGGRPERRFPDLNASWGRSTTKTPWRAA